MSGCAIGAAAGGQYWLIGRLKQNDPQPISLAMRLSCFLAVLLSQGIPLETYDAIDWGTIATERRAFFTEGNGKRYETQGKFNGVGEFRFYLLEKRAHWSGICERGLNLHAKPQHIFEICSEEFIITSVIRVNRREYAFEGANQRGGNRITGKFKYAFSTKSVLSGYIESFEMEQHGIIGTGVMDRYSIAASPQATALRAKHQDLYLGETSLYVDLAGWTSSGR